MVSASSSTSSPLSEKDLPPLFLLRRLLRFLLGGLFLGLRFYCLFLLGRFLLRRFFGRFLPRWLGCRFWRGSLFLSFFADDYQLLFLGFDDLFGFPRQLLVVFQPGQLVVVFEIELSRLEDDEELAGETEEIVETEEEELVIVVFQPGQLVVVFEIVLLDFH